MFKIGDIVYNQFNGDWKAGKIVAVRLGSGSFEIMSLWSCHNLGWTSEGFFRKATAAEILQDKSAWENRVKKRIARII